MLICAEVQVWCAAMSVSRGLASQPSSVPGSASDGIPSFARLRWTPLRQSVKIEKEISMWDETDEDWRFEDPVRPKYILKWT